MGDVIDLNSIRLRSAICALEPGKLYYFHKRVQSLFIVKGETSAREIKFFFNKGIFVRYDEQEDLLVFKGEPIVDPGGLGQGFFAVSSEMALIIKKADQPPKKEG